MAGLVGCAHQPIKSNLALNEKVYQSYTHLVSGQSYAYNGKVSFNVAESKQPATATPVAPAQQITALSHDQIIRQKILLDTLRQRGISQSDQTQLMENLFSVSSSVPSRYGKDKKLNKFMETLLSRYYYAFDGVMDLKHGQMSFNPKIGYEAKNLQAWLVMPMAVDLRNSKAYADLSAISPLVTDPKYDGRYVVFDFSKLIQSSGIDTKQAYQLIKEMSLVNVAMANASDYQPVALTADDQKMAGVERIRYQGDYANLISQYFLFFYLNQNHIKSLFSKDNRIAAQLGLDHISPNQQKQPDQSESKDLRADEASDRLQESLDQLTENNDADAVSVTVEDVATSKRYPMATKIDQLNKDVQDDTVIMPAVSATEAATQAVSEKTSTESLSDDEETETANSDGVSKANIQLALQAFDQYRSEKLIDSKQMKQIVAAHPQPYQQLISAVKQKFDEDKLFKDATYTTDLVLDREGRLRHMNMVTNLGSFEEFGINKVSSLVNMNIYDYGKAKVDQSKLKESVSFKDAANQNTVLNLGQKFEALEQIFDAKKQKNMSHTRSNQERYSLLVDRLISQNVNFIDAYATVYKYAYIVESEDEISEDFEEKDLNNTARWTAIYQASQHGLPYSAQQYQEYENSPEEWYYYEEDLSERLFEIFDTQMTAQRLKTQFANLKRQKLSNQQIFSRLYQAEALRHLQVDHPKIKTLDANSVHVINQLSQYAIQDMNGQRNDSKALNNLNPLEIAKIDQKIYRDTYRAMLDQ